MINEEGLLKYREHLITCMNRNPTGKHDVLWSPYYMAGFGNYTGFAILDFIDDVVLEGKGRELPRPEPPEGPLCPFT